MVSDIIDKFSGFLRHGVEMAWVMLETQSDGNINNDHLADQVERAIDIFEHAHP